VLFFYIFFYQKLALGAKTATFAKLRGRFCSFFFLGGENRNFMKVRRQKLLLSLKKKTTKNRANNNGNQTKQPSNNKFNHFFNKKKIQSRNLNSNIQIKL